MNNSAIIREVHSNLHFCITQLLVSLFNLSKKTRELEIMILIVYCLLQAIGHEAMKLNLTALS